MNLLEDINNPLWESKGVIYCYTNLINGKKYIGQTIKTLRHRHQQHMNETKYKNLRAYNHYFHRAIRKYGIENFSLNILIMNCENYDKLNNYEQFYIERFKSLSIQNGYNMCNGGNNCNKLACKTGEEIAEWKSKISDSVKGENHPLYGTKMSEETKRKISESEKGKKMSEESKKKMSKTRTGKKHSEKTKNKIGKAHKGKIVSDESRKKMSESKEGTPVVRIDKNLSIVFYKKMSYTEFDTSSISRCCKGKQKTCCGYKWMYAEDYYKYILELD